MLKIGQILDIAKTHHKALEHEEEIRAMLSPVLIAQS
jgi:hypothetical protein